MHHNTAHLRCLVVEASVQCYAATAREPDENVLPQLTGRTVIQGHRQRAAGRFGHTCASSIAGYTQCTKRADVCKNLTGSPICFVKAPRSTMAKLHNLARIIGKPIS